MEVFELDPYSAETPLSFSDVNILNEQSQRLLMIRNNDTDRICYLIDFTSGKLIMSFKTSINEYKINGYISPDGNMIATDQYYYTSYNNENPEKNRSYRATAIYDLLDENEVMEQVEKLKNGRVLTDDEKIQIGIK